MNRKREKGRGAEKGKRKGVKYKKEGKGKRGDREIRDKGKKGQRRGGGRAERKRSE